MFWGLKRHALLDRDDEEWQLDCWAWLIRHLGGLDVLRATPLFVPTVQFFQRPGQHDHPGAHYFAEVVRLAGLEDWPFRLVEQDRSVDPVIAPLAVVHNVAPDPAGTFRVASPKEILITYSPDLLSRPDDLIATFAHEVSHALVMNIGEEPPGGWTCEEFATDLTVAFIGFGLFGANSAFRFAQYTDSGTGTQGWSVQRAGYLTQLEWSFALAVFLTLKDEEPAQALRFLNDGPAASLKKCLKYLNRYPDCLQTIRDQINAEPAR